MAKIILMMYGLHNVEDFTDDQWSVTNGFVLAVNAAHFSREVTIIMVGFLSPSKDTLCMRDTHPNAQTET